MAVRWRDENRPGRGVWLHVRRVVEPTAPPVVLLHGLGVAGGVWQAFARRLLPYLAAMAPDLRGHGQSDAPPTGYAPTDYAADLIVMLEDMAQGNADMPADNTDMSRANPAMPPDTTGLPRAHANIALPVPIVGHSLGALVALELAALRPELVSWLVLLDPPLDPSLPNPEVEAVYGLRRAPPGELEAYLVGRNPGGGQLLAQSLAGLFRQASDAAFEAMLSSRPFRAPTVRQPCLVLQADPEHGGVLGDNAARALVNRLPRGKLQKIDGATHALHASSPAEVARAILAFGGYSSDVGSSGVGSSADSR